MVNLVQKIALIAGITFVSLSCSNYSKTDSDRAYDDSKNKIEYSHTFRQLDRAYRMRDRDFERMQRRGEYKVIGMEMRDEMTGGNKEMIMEKKGHMMMRQGEGMGMMRDSMYTRGKMKGMMNKMEMKCENKCEGKMDSCDMKGERMYEMKGMMRGGKGMDEMRRGEMEGRGMMRGGNEMDEMRRGEMEGRGMMMNYEMKSQQDKMNIIIERNTPIAVKGEKIKVVKESGCDLTKCSLETKAQQDSCKNSLKK